MEQAQQKGNKRDGNRETISTDTIQYSLFRGTANGLQLVVIIQPGWSVIQIRRAGQFPKCSCRIQPGKSGYRKMVLTNSGFFAPFHFGLNGATAFLQARSCSFFAAEQHQQAQAHFSEKELP